MTYKQSAVVSVISLVLLALMILIMLATGTGEAEEPEGPEAPDLHTVHEIASRAVADAADMETPEFPHWESLGYCRITEYCPSCNDPCGYQSSSGVTLQEGMAACSWLPIGTKLRIGGCEYVVMDTCGTDAIDIFRDSGVYCCECSANYWAEVEVWQG